MKQDLNFEELQFQVTTTLLSTKSLIAKNKLKVYFDFSKFLPFCLFKGHVLSLYVSNSHIITGPGIGKIPFPVLRPRSVGNRSLIHFKLVYKTISYSYAESQHFIFSSLSLIKVYKVHPSIEST